MGRDVETYGNDFLKKLAFEQVRANLRYFPRHNINLHEFARHVNDVENEMGVRRSSGWTPEESKDVSHASRGGGRGGRGGRSGRGGRGGGRGGGASGSGPKMSHSQKTDLWGLDRSVCWHCFTSHPSTNKPCADASCVFCHAKGHLSIRCPTAPTSLEAFKKSVKTP